MCGEGTCTKHFHKVVSIPIMGQPSSVDMIMEMSTAIDPKHCCYSQKIGDNQPLINLMKHSRLH